MLSRLGISEIEVDELLKELRGEEHKRSIESTFTV